MRKGQTEGFPVDDKINKKKKKKIQLNRVHTKAMIVKLKDQTEESASFTQQQQTLEIKGKGITCKISK